VIHLPLQYRAYTRKQFTSFQEYTKEDIRKLLLRSTPKTCLLDPLLTNVLLESVDILLPYICAMCNASLREGLLPATQKMTFISKVIERIVANQLKAHLADNDLMPSVQSAYRQGHSTETAVLKVISDIIDAADTQKVTCLVY